MKKFKIVKAVGALALIFATQISKADDIALGSPIMGGNGCPQGTASAVLSPDYKSLTILFDQFTAEAGANVGRQIDRKACNIAIPIHIPQGLAVSIINVDYRGFVSVPAGGLARFAAQYFLAGSRGPTASRIFSGAQNSDYLVNNKLLAVAWSDCGIDTNLRVNASVLARSNMSGDDTLATVDSADLKSGMIYQLDWQTCGASF